MKGYSCYDVNKEHDVKNMDNDVESKILNFLKSASNRSWIR